MRNMEKRNRAESAISAIANGAPLKTALSDAGLTASEFAHVLQGARDLAVSYARATEIRADLMADEVITIADCEVTDPQRARNQMQARQWLASKQHSRRYGDRIDLNVSQTLDVSVTLAEARARLQRPVSDQQIIEHEETLAIPPKIASKPSD